MRDGAIDSVRRGRSTDALPAGFVRFMAGVYAVLRPVWWVLSVVVWALLDLVGGLVDGLAWWRFSTLLDAAPDVRDPVARIFRNGAMMLAGQATWALLLRPVFFHASPSSPLTPANSIALEADALNTDVALGNISMATGGAFGMGPGIRLVAAVSSVVASIDWLASAAWFCDMLLYLLWTLPWLIVSSIANAFHYADLVDAVQRRAASFSSSLESPRSPGLIAAASRARCSPRGLEASAVVVVLKGLRDQITVLSEETLRLAMLLSASVLAQYLWRYKSWWVRGACFVYMAWIQAMHVFDNWWSLAGARQRLMDKIAIVELHPLYYLGFGAWLAALLALLPSDIATSTYCALLPYFILAALYARCSPGRPANGAAVITRPEGLVVLPFLRALLHAAGLLLRASTRLLALRASCARTHSLTIVTH